MKRLIFLMLALLVAGSARAATKVQVMTDGVIDVDRLPTISFFQENDPASPELGQIWWNNATNQLKVAGALGVYEFNATSLVEWDTTPEAFSFTDVENATTETVYTSAPITVSGINWPATISVSGDASAKYSVNNATAVSTNGTVESGDTVSAVVTSSASDSTATNATVTIGGVSDAYGVTTAEGAAAWAVEDDFSSNTVADYTSIDADTLQIADGAAKSSAQWNAGAFRHSTSIGDDQIIEASVTLVASSRPGVFFRASGTTGYIATPMAGTQQITVSGMSAGTASAGSSFYYSSSFSNDTTYRIKIAISGNTVSSWVDFNSDGDFDDAGESGGSMTKTTYSTGAYAGVAWNNNGSAAGTVNDWRAKAYE